MTRALLDEGVVVIAVEMTTGNRFDVDADQSATRALPLNTCVNTPSELGVDERRIGVAGFSSGASLALLLGTRGAAPTSAGSGLSPRFARPAAVIVSGACADPLSAREDGYFRKSMEKYGDPAQFSPTCTAAHGSATGPGRARDRGRVLRPRRYGQVHGTFTPAWQFRDVGKRAGRESIFSGSTTKPGKAQMRAAIGEALKAWGW
jgi:hypothetical protein